MTNPSHPSSEPIKLTSEAAARLLDMMEEMANMPHEPMGVRQPGERCMYEIQRSEDAERRK